MSLVVIIGLVWLGLLAVITALCAAGASADRREVQLLRLRRAPGAVGRWQPRSAPARAAQARSAQARAEAARSEQRQTIGA